ncbi:Signal transduction histidine kinase [Flavobacterium fontis]|uniref:histidine kinase n=1 Tax=Flavobacterium fontis TaxID=1124188 RepID=A0A1M5AIK3_9FLAO|nr:hybrid sensor histidine kinase/response regulator [Flavobacterium fontis]SHF29975.1 Signal transduction histidine kinase [Flavobacterium fontis]
MRCSPNLRMVLGFMSLFWSGMVWSQFRVTSPSLQEESLHRHAVIYKDATAKLTLEAVQQLPLSAFTPFVVENTDLGFTTATYWLRFSIKNELNHPVSYYLETARPIIDKATLYGFEGKKRVVFQESGDRIPISQKSVKQRKTLFTITLPAHQEYQYWIRLQSDGEVINAPLLLRSSDQLLDTIAFEQVVFGFFYGMLLLSAIIYLFFFFAMKQRVFLNYSLYVFFIGMLQFSVDGFFHYILAPNGGWFSDKAVIFFAIIAGYFLGRYAQYYLEVWNVSTLINRLFYGLYVFLAGLMVITLWVPDYFYLTYPLMNLAGLFELLLIIFTLWVIYFRTRVIYQFFSLGILSLVTGFVVFILKNLSVLPVSFATENSSKLGTGLEVIFLSLSMANLIKKLRDDREQLQIEALRKSEEMNEMKTYFLSNISHELRTPLNAILNYSDAILQESEAPTIREKCEVIRSNSRSLLGSVNDILDFSKIEKEAMTLDPQPFDLKQLLNDLHQDFKNRATEKQLDFQWVVEGNVPHQVVGDRDRIRQVFYNLLQNALKFTAEGMIKFRVELTTEGTLLQVKGIISDTGEGIPKSKMDQIYESFTQQRIDNKRKYGGLGLGLYIVKALITQMNGTLHLDSLVNQGTVCTLTFPLEIVEAEAPIRVATPEERDWSDTRLLVVEDNMMNQMVLKMIFKKWPHLTVDYAMHGEEALTYLSRQEYNLILMDLQMPIMDGYETTQAIRKGQSGINSAAIPIIAVTADVMEATKVRVRELGMNHYMTKPVDKAQLLEAIVAYRQEL